MTEFYDDLETRDPEKRETAHFQSLGPFLQQVASEAPGWAKRLDGVDLQAVKSRADLVQIPVLRKPEMMAAQTENPPFGGFAAINPGQGGRIFMSPGPVYEPQGKGPDPWRAGRSLFAAGFRRGDIVHNSFSYHLTPGAFILDEGLRALGCMVMPAGVGQTEQQVEAAAHIKPTGFVGTPDFLKVLLDRAQDVGLSLASISKALVSGGALFPSLRKEYRDRGVSVLQAYATADAGVIAYESDAMEGLIVDEGVILEIVRPGTDDPVPDGEVGEVVITVFNPSYPLVRFGTGDLSAVLDGQSPCGRTNMRIKGWMGRADQRTKVKGMFVDPKQVAEIAARHPEIEKARLVVTRDGDSDAMMLRVAASVSTDAESFLERVVETMSDVTKMKGSVEIVAKESLPNDGVVIADERDYDG
ncbi:MAG: AMP-binding protein [Pseudomonadota bacterium]